MSDEIISKEWARLFTSQLERHEKTISEQGERCRACREDLIDRIAEVKTKQRELVVKITIFAVAAGIGIDVAIRYFVK